jgi:hypothetical protein
MEAATVNTWLAPSELALSEAFLAILSLEYRGFKLNTEIELIPLDKDVNGTVCIQWTSPSKLEIYKIFARSRKQYCLKRITVKLA